MKYVLALFSLMFALFSQCVLADPPGGRGPHAMGGVAGTPPGLQGEALPHGLSKQNKTPPGWSKGRKRGWYKRHHHTVKHNNLENHND